MNTPTSKLVTARFLTAAANHIAAEARKVQGLEDEPVRAAVRKVMDIGKQLMDARAAEIAANSPAPTVPSPGRTNVGDPNPKGTGGGKQKR